eukprot:170652-Heterocapsa_arctica.AAC.1
MCIRDRREREREREREGERVAHELGDAAGRQSAKAMNGPWAPATRAIGPVQSRFRWPSRGFQNPGGPN